MEMQTLARFFLWCTLLNGGLLSFSFLIKVFAGDFVYGLHSRWFAISREAFDLVFYCLIGGYKLLLFVFNLMPWIVLTLMS